MSEPSLSEATRIWARIGLLSFGGPAAQIALMNREVVEERGWLSEREFLSALSFCMLLPGPEAMQLATYSGWKLHGLRGGLIAGGLFVLPGALVLMLLAALYATFGNIPLVDALFLGVKASVIAIVLEALIRISKKALVGRLSIALAVMSFIALFSFAVPYPLIVIAAAATGFFAARSDGPEPPVRLDQSLGGTLKTAIIWLAIWLLPLILLDWATGGGLLAQVGWFFSKLALVTFGGAYAVLAYMAQEVVQDLGWLKATEMVDGLGLAETTPGPLILVTQFVGFLAGFREGGLPLAIAAAGVTLWVTFVPCFAWIFTGAPYVDWLSNQPRLRGALGGITAAVVGVIAHLSLWFAMHVLFAEVVDWSSGPVTMSLPALASLHLDALALAILGCGLLLGLKWTVLRTIAACALAGLVLGWL